MRTQQRKRAYDRDHRIEAREATKRRCRSLRSMVLLALGGRCADCGQADAKCLQIEHVLGGGRRERKRTRTTRWYNQILSGATETPVELLCANCNWLRYVTRIVATSVTWNSVRTRTQKAALRARVLAHLGGACACGVTDPRVLNIDHVHGGGCAERHSIGRGTRFLKLVLASEPGRYQLLCCNCNWIKRATNEAERPGPKMGLPEATAVAGTVMPRGPTGS